MSHLFCTVGGFLFGYLAAALLGGKRSDAAAGVAQMRDAAERLVAACREATAAELSRLPDGDVVVDARMVEALADALDVDRRLRSA